MVCEKEPGCPKDMDREGLDLLVEGDFVTARGTTLGSDDGIAVAMALAILDANDIPHHRLEAVFTVDEEIGMLGAVAMDVSPLQGRQLINLDVYKRQPSMSATSSTSAPSSASVRSAASSDSPSSF